MNPEKERFVLDFIRDYRNLSVRVGTIQWRLFFEKGCTDKHKPATHLNDICGAAQVQMASYQVQEQVDGWVSNRANEFVDCVKDSTLAAEIKHQLYTINDKRSWFLRGDVTWRQKIDKVTRTETIPTETRNLARSIMRHCMGKHRRPNLSNISPRIDQRGLEIAKADKAHFADMWAWFTVPHRGQMFIPIHGTARFANRGGEVLPSLLFCTDERNRITFRLTQDMAKPFAASRAAYVPKIDVLGMDFGLSTMLATSEGTRHGVGLIKDLRALDTKIVGIARHRARSGGKGRDSLRYRKLVERVRGMLKTRINTALNRIVGKHKPSEISVERLDFRIPGMSKWMNRLITNCGRALVRTKLADLTDKFGIATTEENAAYTSQECCLCHYVDARNRRSRSEFACRWCGSEMDADINAARVIAQRRSMGLDRKWLNKAKILDALVSQHIKRFRRSLGTAADPRLDNPYFAKQACSTTARMLKTQGIAYCS